MTTTGGALMRTWTATMDADGVTLQAGQSKHDLLRDQTVQAVLDAAVLLDDARQVVVSLWKTTKAHGTRYDRSYVVFRDRQGAVRYQ